MNHRCLVIAASLPLVLSGCTMAQDGAISQAYSAIGKGEYEKALAQLSLAASYSAPDRARQAEIDFLAGRSHEGLGNLPPAIRPPSR